MGPQHDGAHSVAMVKHRGLHRARKAYSVCGGFGRGHFGNLDVDLRALAFKALNIHLELIAVEKAQALVDVADADATSIDFGEPLRRNAEAVVLDLDRESTVTEMRAEVNLPAFQTRREAVLDSVFNHGLQEHAGDDGIASVFVHFLEKQQFVAAEADHFDVERIVNEVQLFHV